MAQPECPETWLARRLAAGKPAETWKPIPGWPHEASDQGRVRTVKGRMLASRRNRRNPDSYPQYDLWNPETKEHLKGVPAHWCVLSAHAGPRPDGMEASHLHDHPEWNWYPENLAWEDKPANERRKSWRPPPPAPSFPCKNAPACDGKALHPGRRCMSCALEVQRESAAMLDRGEPLPAVAAHFELSERWVWQQAVKGGYKGDLEQARTQRPPLTGWRRAVARLVGAA